MLASNAQPSNLSLARGGAGSLRIQSRLGQIVRQSMHIADKRNPHRYMVPENGATSAFCDCPHHVTPYTINCKIKLNSKSDNTIFNNSFQLLA